MRVAFNLLNAAKAIVRSKSRTGPKETRVKNESVVSPLNVLKKSLLVSSSTKSVTSASPSSSNKKALFSRDNQRSRSLNSLRTLNKGDQNYSKSARNPPSPLRRASNGGNSSSSSSSSSSTTSSRSWNTRRIAREILFEDKNILIINKGYGLTVQGDPDAKSLVHSLPDLAVRRSDQLR